MKICSSLKGILVLATAIFSSVLVAQDFYVKDGNPYLTNYPIPSNWIHLDFNEGVSFLQNLGFSDVKIKLNGDKQIIVGEIKKDGYIYAREIAFRDDLVSEYTDAIYFIHYCHLCFINEVLRRVDYTYMPDLKRKTEEDQRKAIRDDAELREVFYRMHSQSLLRDGIETPLMGDITDAGFRFENHHNDGQFTIDRLCALSLSEEKVYQFISTRRVTINKVDYVVGEHDLNTANQYDLPLMVDIFLEDCANNGIHVKHQEVVTSFEPLEGNILGLSYAMNNDNLIKIRIDPEKWANASVPKRWYLLYHELGHDVLNLEHGSGGKMMFNFSDKGYSWEEFWEDREYMFNSYKRMQNE